MTILMRRARAAAATGALILCTSATTFPQINTGEIAAVVRDSSGGVLPGAAVTGTHGASGTVIERVTDTEGRVLLPALRWGEWDVTVAFPGFASETRTDIIVEIGRSLGLEFTMEIRGLAEEVVVRFATRCCRPQLLKSAT